MKKFIFCTFLFLPLISNAGIGENFEPAGISLGGSGIFTFTSFDAKEGDYRLMASILPTLGIMTVRNLEANMFLGYAFNYHKSNSKRLYNMILGGAGLKYFFVKNPDLNQGIVSSLGIMIDGHFFIHSDNENTYGFTISPGYNMYFFVTERIAPYWGLHPSFGIWDVQEPALYVNLNVSFGISFHFPRKMRVTHKLKK